MRITDDWYEILQVHESAEPEVIEAAYKRLVRKYHPDVSASPNATELMQRLNQAYEILRDPRRRAAYDQWRRGREQAERRRTETPPRAQQRPQTERSRRTDQRQHAHGRVRPEQNPQHGRRRSHEPASDTRSSSWTSEWTGILFLVALLAISGSDTLQNSLNEAWSWATQPSRRQAPARSPAVPDASSSPPPSRPQTDGAPATVQNGLAEPQRSAATRPRPTWEQNSEDSLQRLREQREVPLYRPSTPAASRPTRVAARPDVTPSSRRPARPSRTPDVDALSAAELAAIERMCRHVGPVQGPAAYARCIEEGKRNRPDFSGVGVDARRDIERMCGHVGPVRGPAAYARCVEEGKRSRPDFSGVSVDARRDIERMCGHVGPVRGPAAYARCVEEGKRSRPDFSGVSVDARRDIERMCGHVGPVRGPAAYARCVEEGKRNRPDFRGVNPDTRRDIERMCGHVGPVRGPAAYARCVEEGKRSLRR